MKIASRALVAAARIAIEEEAPLYSSVVLEDSPTGYWRLGGNGLHSEVGVTPTASGGAATNAASLIQNNDGNAACHFTKFPRLVLADYRPSVVGYTWEMWVKADAAPSSSGTGRPVHGSGKGQLNWDHSDAGFRGAWNQQDGGTWKSASFGALSGNTTYHLVALNTGTHIQAWKNGVLMTSTACAVRGPLIQNFEIADGFTGVIDEVAFYDGKALNQERIEYHYQVGAGLI